MNRQFIVHLSNKQKHLMTKELIQGHVSYLGELKQQGKLPFCGPCKDETAIMILKADSLEEAEELLAGDLFTRANYYQDRRIVEVEEATPENNFLFDDVLVNLRNHS
ncbi:YciI family protein [Alicyclobacillus acidoterrestris]|uniref:YciI family protein n=1 Tax=Alicyclobacillus acidoterrestris (strain ATCC 49025 / DSM 3922 / CIP 106132 / NCIMB 13137 / GD3B) TaxID=1356854 RepID=T0BZ10_ALIAG|nr:YciI family protein [Alicyclobacillus acidoterrestris]EPZ45625.1 hypothetical protein N007_08250 [Alicyclobacillus acidoterrestris ATCC 49025]UNO47306.1 YciI family protein [Alicyclobacillus acidoterrestris]